MSSRQQKPDASGAKHEPSSERTLLVAIAACCAVPMVAIVVLTSIVGVTLGPAVAVSLGLVAAMVCVAVMVQHHRGGHDRDEAHHEH
jgi:Flp pilus assembly protein TadB